MFHVLGEKISQPLDSSKSLYGSNINNSSTGETGFESSSYFECEWIAFPKQTLLSLFV